MLFCTLVATQVQTVEQARGGAAILRVHTRHRDHAAVLILSRSQVWWCQIRQTEGSESAGPASLSLNCNSVRRTVLLVQNPDSLDVRFTILGTGVDPGPPLRFATPLLPGSAGPTAGPEHDVRHGRFRVRRVRLVLHAKSIVSGTPAPSGDRPGAFKLRNTVRHAKDPRRRSDPR